MIAGQRRKMALPDAMQIGARPRVDAAWTQDVTPSRAAAEIVDTEIGFTGPATVVALFRDAFDVLDRVGEPAGSPLSAG